MKTILWPSVRGAFLRFTAPLEGRVRHLYLDILGLPTIGLGYLVRDVDAALRLPLLDAASRPASPDAIRDEYHRIEGNPELARLGHRAAGRLATLHLDDATIDRLALERLDVMARDLARRFTALPAWPADAQLAVCSMSWAMGSGWPSKFPKCSKHLDSEDFMSAASECTIREVGNPGVIPRNRINRALFEAAEWCIAQGVERDVLYGY